MGDISSSIPEQKRFWKFIDKKTFIEMPTIPEKLIKFSKIEELKFHVGKGGPIELPSKSPCYLEKKDDLEIKNIVVINIRGKIPAISGEINIEGSRIDVKHQILI